MSVFLSTSKNLCPDGWDCWTAIGRPMAIPDPAKQIRGLPARIEEAFEAVSDQWWTLARDLGSAPSAWAAHAPAAATNASDLGLMLAWAKLVDGWAADKETVLVLCDDPWMFRHLAGRSGVRAGIRPGLSGTGLRLHLRGFLARAWVAVRMAYAAIICQSQRQTIAQNTPAVLVYGHPASRSDGHDAYFGDLLRDNPSLVRLLHTDCGPIRARTLTGDGRTASLHAWGNPLAALTVLGARWTPSPTHLTGPHGWLVRRAAMIENSRGNIAMTYWQNHCQRRWLADRRPRAVAWPWENHPWERALVRAARHENVRTIGYQHSVVGRHMLNYAGHSNPDGTASLPERILCVGPATRAHLARWGIPEDRLSIGGAWRFSVDMRVRFDPTAPVFFALPFGGAIAAEMMNAARDLAAAGRRVLVRDHPMTPFPFAPTPNLVRADKPLSDQDAVAAVVYAATTVGLEARLAGLPTIRFRPAGVIAVDILPEGASVPATERESIVADVNRLIAAGPAAAIPREAIFAPVDKSLWSRLLQGTKENHS